MQEKNYLYLAIATGLITFLPTFFPAKIFNIFNTSVAVIISIFTLSLAYFISSKFYNKKNNSTGEVYSVGRHIVLAVFYVLPILPIVFTASFLYPYITGKAFIFRFVSIAAVFACIYLILKQKEIKLEFNYFSISALLLTFLLFISNLNSVDVYRAFFSNFERMEGFWNTLLILGLILSAVIIKIKDVEWKGIFKVHIFVSSVIAFIAIMQFVTGFYKLEMFTKTTFLEMCLKSSVCKPDATFGNSIYLSIYAALTAWIIFYAYIKEKIHNTKSVLKYVFPILIFLNIFVMYLSGSRGAMLGFVVGSVFALVPYLILNKRLKLAAASILISVFCIFSFAQFISYANANALYQDTEIIRKFGNINTIFSRWNVWQIAIVSFLDKPVLGWGQENFTHAFNLNFNPKMHGQETFFDHAHNTYLDYLVAGGFLGFFAFIIFLLSTVLVTVKNYIPKWDRVEIKKIINENQNNIKFLLPISFGFLLTYFVYIFFVFDNLISILFFVVVSIYFSNNLVNRTFEFQNPLSKYFKNIESEDFLKYVRPVFYVTFSIIIFYFIYKPSAANTRTIEAMQNAQNGPQETVDERIKTTQKLFERALSYSTFGDYEIKEYFVQEGFAFVSKHGGMINLQKDARSITALTDFMEKAVALEEEIAVERPFDHRILFSVGLSKLNLRKSGEAVKYLEKAIALAPNKQFSLIYLAKAYLENKQLREGVGAYEKAITLTDENLQGFNDMNLEYINVLLTNDDRPEIADFALNRIHVLNSPKFEVEVNGLMQKIYVVVKSVKNLQIFENRLNVAMGIDSENLNFKLFKIIILSDQKKTKEIEALLGTIADTVIRETLEKSLFPKTDTK